jgi:pimeloyl-ACP methyl ester carboxylesterase
MAAKSFATVNGLKTHYLHAGTGPTLILLHGQLPGSTAAIEFGATVDHFASLGYAVYAPDLAGFGLTDNPPDHAIETRIAHARGFIDFVAPPRYAIWGCSMGTYIGAQIALDDPRVDRLIIMPSNVLPPAATTPARAGQVNVGALVQGYTPTPENARALLSLVLVDHARLDDELVRAFVAASSGKNEAAEHGRRAAPRPKPLYGELQHLKVPSLLLWGADDPGATPERALLLLAAIPGAELHLLRQCGHWPQYDQPARTFHLADDFIRTNR